MKEKVLKLGRWLEQFPYENLSKRQRMQPRDVDVVAEEREQFGAGGTCFSLVNLGAYKAEKMGLKPRYYLGDRPDGPNRHCVLGLPEPGVFIDPGYLCYRPLPLELNKHISLVRQHNILHLSPAGPDHIKIETERKKQRTWRYTLKCEPIGQDRFEAAWRDSFNWYTVMDSVCLTRLRANDMLCYLNGRLESVTRSQRQEISPPTDVETDRYLARLFRVDPDLMDEWDLPLNSSD